MRLRGEPSPLPADEWSSLVVIAAWGHANIDAKHASNKPVAFGETRRQDPGRSTRESVLGLIAARSAG
jgi:hypothetical protein